MLDSMTPWISVDVDGRCFHACPLGTCHVGMFLFLRFFEVSLHLDHTRPNHVLSSTFILGFVAPRCMGAPFLEVRAEVIGFCRI